MLIMVSPINEHVHIPLCNAMIKEWLYHTWQPHGLSQGTSLSLQSVKMAMLTLATRLRLLFMRRKHV